MGAGGGNANIDYPQVWAHEFGGLLKCLSIAAVIEVSNRYNRILRQIDEVSSNSFSILVVRVVEH